MKVRYILAIILLIAVALFLGAQNIDFDNFYRHTAHNTLEQLNKKSGVYYRKGRVDSAMACLSVICNRYDKSMEDMDKDLCARAFNNVGYIYFYNYCNYYLAYANYLKAIDIAKDINDTRILPGLYTNIGNVYENYDDKENAIKLYKKAYYAALSIQDWPPLYIAYVSLITNSVSSAHGLNGVKDVMKSFSSLKIPADSRSLFATHISRGAYFILSKRYFDAAKEFDEASRNLDSNMLSERDYASAIFLKAKAYELCGRYDLAIRDLESTISFLSDKNANDVMCALYESLAFYASKIGDKAKAEKCKFKFYELEHEMFGARKFGKIHEMKATYDMKKMDEQVAEIKARKRMQTIVLYVVSGASLIIILLLTSLYFKSRRQQQLFRDLYRKNVETIKNDERALKGHYYSSNLDDNSKRQLLDKIHEVMLTNDEIYGKDFSIERLAELVGDRPRNVSQVINELSGKNFSVLLGEYRIKEACKRLCNDEVYGRLTIEGIALGLGFKSRPNFVNVFKKMTGLTPSEFQRMHKMQ
jgi:AraC-like DNA-binding protein